MGLEVKIFNRDLEELNEGFSDIREFASRWCPRSLDVQFSNESPELLQKFGEEIGKIKVGCYVFL